MLDVILTSCPPAQAQRIADELVERHVAACVTLLPGAVSTYRWQGKVQRDQETLLLIKVPTERTAACVEALKQAHPNTVPEIMVLPAGDVAASYLAWAREVCELPTGMRTSP